ncbi:(d)CMP kinase [Candidatus Saccharibacteria bacterium]|nr:(d)CMP kinase [Candidatus Saccharibacteria bacterium]
MKQSAIPKLVTFDGEARSGKGTIVQATKDYLRDECGYKVMLIDRGQTFRVLVVAAGRAGVDMNIPAELDTFLQDQQNVTDCVQFVKDVYHMDKDERDALLYTSEVGEKSAKVGARPASQDFVADLTKKWLWDARTEGYEVVLVDGRCLEGIASEMHADGLCDYRMGLYFICDARVGARRTLGYAATPYDELGAEQMQQVDQLVQQIYERNERDRNREVERMVPPADAPTLHLPDVPHDIPAGTPRPMFVIDTSAEISKEAMSLPVATLTASILAK